MKPPIHCLEIPVFPTDQAGRQDPEHAAEYLGRPPSSTCKAPDGPNRPSKGLGPLKMKLLTPSTVRPNVSGAKPGE